MKLKINIIDYDAGTLRNVQKAIDRLGYSSMISKKTESVAAADALILPGVGSFKQGMASLRSSGLYFSIRKQVLEQKKPIFGICLGMQLLARDGHEGGKCSGLNLLPMSVRPLSLKNHGLRTPHMGWNSVYHARQSLLLSGIPDGGDFYFVHSYHAVCNDQSIVATTCDYGGRFVAAVHKDNVFGTQFHPEKSQRYGLRLLKNFLEYCEANVSRGTESEC